MTQVIMNKTVRYQRKDKHIKLGDYGIFGPCLGYANRFEFSKRGALHLHQILYFKKENGEINQKLLQYWAALFGSWNLDNLQKDRQLIEEFQLNHACSSKCLILDDYKRCREGFPKIQQDLPTYSSKNPLKLNFRRRTKEEQYIYNYDRDTVKLFDASVIVKILEENKIVEYLLKSSMKTKNWKRNGENVEHNVSKIQQINKQVFQQVTDFINQKITTLSECFSELLQYPLFSTSFHVINISQSLFVDQQKWEKTQVGAFGSGAQQTDCKNSLQSTNWNKYMARPQEFEMLNFIEYFTNFNWYGLKKKEIKKVSQESSIKLIDYNGHLVKERKKGVQVFFRLSSLYFFEDRAKQNDFYYLAMLQLFWPHRQESWMRFTQDNWEGFKRHYDHLIQHFNLTTIDKVQNNYKNLYCRYQGNSFKQHVLNYKNLTPEQQQYLDDLSNRHKNKSNSQKNDGSHKPKNKKVPLSFASMFRSKNCVTQLYGLLQQHQSFTLREQIAGVLNYLRPEHLLNIALTQQIEEVESKVIDYIKGDNIIEKDYQSQSIINLFALLLSQKGFPLLAQEIEQQRQSEVQQIKQNDPLEFSQVNLRQVELRDTISNFHDQNTKFSQHFRKQLSVKEFFQLERPKFKGFVDYCPSNNLQKQYETCNRQQKMAIVSILTYLVQSQVTNEQSAFYEGIVVHGGGGVGKSYIISYLMNFFYEVHLDYFILCPTQVAVQNLINTFGANTGIQSDVMTKVQTIHSFFNFSVYQTVDYSWNHFLTFVRMIRKSGVFEYSTNSLYPELAYYNCLNKVDSFTEKMNNVHCIILEEISMLDPKFISLLDIYLQVSLSCNLPFGGVLVLAFGDSFQLQPVLQNPAFYFDSHLFKNGYFSLLLELTEPVRQANDLEYYEKILQPIRLGIFLNSPQVDQQLDILKGRHLDPNVNPSYAHTLNTQVQGLLVENNIVYLYLENQAVNEENKVRASEQIFIRQMNAPSHRPYRHFYNRSIQMCFAIRKTKQDIFLMNLASQQYNITTENLAYTTHYLLLPLTIRNYLISTLLPYVCQYAESRDRSFKNQFSENLILFKDARVVIKKNINKQQQLINGQAATIKDLIFDIDLDSDKTLKQALKRKEDAFKNQYTGENSLLEKRPEQTSKIYELENGFKNWLLQDLQDKKLNHTNHLVEQDILHTERIGLVDSGIYPRLVALKLHLFGQSPEQITLFDNLLDNCFKKIVKTPRQMILSVAQKALTAIYKILETVQPDTIESKIIQQAIRDADATYILSLSIASNNLSYNVLIQAKYHLEKFIENLPDTDEVFKNILIFLIDCTVPLQISQLPLNLAYARTIHTSQGATFNNVVLGLQAGQSQKQPGLLYTALSRVKTLQQLFLQGDFSREVFQVWLNQQNQINLSVPVPWEITQFYKNYFIEAQELVSIPTFQNIVALKMEELLPFIIHSSDDVREDILASIDRIKRSRRE